MSAVGTLRKAEVDEAYQRLLVQTFGDDASYE